MATAKFHSLFLLLSAFLLTACQTSADKRQSQKEAEIISLIEKANDTNLQAKERLANSSAAYRLAQHTDKALLRKAFNSRYSLLWRKSPDSAAAFLEKYRTNALAKKDTLNLANAYYYKAYQIWKARPDSAYFYFDASKREYELCKDSLEVAEKLLCMADISWRYNDYISTETLSTEAFGYLDPELHKAKDLEYAISAYNYFGLAYIGQADYDSASEAYEKASRLEKDSTKLKTIENNKAWASIEKADFDTAIRILEPLVKSASTLADTINAARIYDNYGYSLFRTGNISGLDWMLRAKHLREKKKNTYGLIPTYVHLAEYCKKDYGRANDYLQKAYLMANANKSPDDRLYVLQHLRKLTTGILRQKYSDIYISLNDSIDSVRLKAKTQFAKIRYDSKKDKEDKLKLTAQKAQMALEAERASNRIVLLFLFAIFLIVFGTMLYFLMKRKHRAEKIKSADRAKEDMSRKVHDELANDIHHAVTFAETQDLSDAQKKENLISSLDSMYARARDISRENNPIDTGEHYPDLLAEMLSEYNSANTNVLIHGMPSIQWHTVPDYHKETIWRALQELMVNMKKHSGATLAAIRFENLGRQWKVSYSDNGVGMPDGKLVLKNGLQNVENRIRAIGGTVIFENEPGKGLKVFIAWPS